MLYVLLIYEAESETGAYTERDQADALAGHRRLQEEARTAGTFREATQLTSAAASTSVRMRRGSIAITDGPFVETKELLLGYYILDCANLDEAIRYARKIPHAPSGGIEIRPVAYHARSSTEAVVWKPSASP